MDNFLLFRNCAEFVIPRPRKALRGRVLLLAALVAVFALSASGSSFAQILNIYDYMIDNADDLGEDAIKLTEAMNGAACVDQKAFRDFTRKASGLAGYLAVTEQALEASEASLRSFSSGKKQDDFADPRIASDLNLLSHEIEWIDGVSNDLIKALRGLKKRPCPEPVTPPPPPTSAPLPPVTPHVVTCAPCQRISDEIERNAKKIASLERSQASLRKYSNLSEPGIQRALKEDDAKIAGLRAQNALLETRLKTCLEQCQPKQTGYIGGGYRGGELGSNSARALGWTLVIGGNAGAGQTWNRYGDFPTFNGDGWSIGGFAVARYYLSPSLFVAPEVGGMALRVKGTNPDGAFSNIQSVTYEGGQIGYSLNAPGATRVNLYVGAAAVQARFNVGIDSRTFFESMSKTLDGWSAHTGIEFQLAPAAAPNWWMGVDYRYSHVCGDIGGDPVGSDIHLVSVTASYQFSIGK